jgi:hypothetical protein
VNCEALSPSWQILLLERGLFSFTAEMNTLLALQSCLDYFPILTPWVKWKRLR